MNAVLLPVSRCNVVESDQSKTLLLYKVYCAFDSDLLEALCKSELRLLPLSLKFSTVLFGLMLPINLVFLSLVKNC